MAEAAGLALGVLGLAGLIGAFKDTIDLFNTAVDMHHMGRQYQVLDIKLDIEKTLLLQGADRRYGLRLEIDTEALISLPISTSMSLGPDLSELSSELFSGPIPLQHVASSQQRDPSQSASVAQKTRWVIRDKQKLEILVQDLAELTAKFDQSGIELIKKDVRKLLLFQEAAANHEAIAQSTQKNLDRMRQTRILNTLWFSMINDSLRDKDLATHDDIILPSVAETRQPFEVILPNTYSISV
ncbi:hypothetical protein FOC1_g10003902 [Fusarium oxysporum f. sp. cubense race 1]|uniref:Prion-inhibition and propagation HeLo domain-containing protein n=1 Tax=Fusarium oxysporum f. sp. cubense (strain race 1) TaxID=1229664 RepID=N4V031_FUSC1|nr:hypothetical protein FOC1_g10003902 [Fusarium oxysporum f. sp. cubense race 1]